MNDRQELVGLITRGDVLKALSNPENAERPVSDFSPSQLRVAFPDEPLRDAINRMAQYDIGRLPVVSRGEPCRAIGYLGRSALISAQMFRLKEETLRESRWF